MSKFRLSSCFQDSKICQKGQMPTTCTCTAPQSSHVIGCHLLSTHSNISRLYFVLVLKQSLPSPQSYLPSLDEFHTRPYTHILANPFHH